MRRVEGRTMVIHRLLLKVVVLLLGAVLGPYHNHLAEADDSMTKPGCRSTCGNLSIPYPFGLLNSDPNCHYDDSPSLYTVECDNSTDPPTPYFDSKDSNLQTLDISLEDHEMQIATRFGRACYDSSGYDASSSFFPNLTLGHFPMSNTKNKFFAVGCDTVAKFGDRRGRFAFGCISACNDITEVSDGSCSGIGCCETSIPRNSFDYNITFSSFTEHAEVLSFNPCSYAFVAASDFYSFSSGDLSRLPLRKVPLVLDWAIGNQTCEDAKKDSTSYMCTENTRCTDAENGSGYKCACLPGFRGNPYLANGCQDIDECADPNKNQCEAVNGICTNVVGSYTCSCVKGYHGDGWKDRQGCTANANPSHLVQILVGFGAGLGALLLLLLLWLLYKFMKKRKEIKLKEKYFKQNGGLLLQQRLLSSENKVDKSKLFDTRDLEKATDNFNENRILGQGGQGTVYKGMLPDGGIVAIKKSKGIDSRKVEQFINEIAILSQINHRNVVKLLGCCLETESPLLVYEFISNGTLFQYLHDPNEDLLVSWDTRLRIATEVAGALSYLHSSASIPIYHRDIKSSNILLDEKNHAKVADFGTSKSVTLDQTHVTTKVQGTFGYLDPEYFQSSQFTDKSDVYSFGIVLVELMTGQKPISFLRDDEERNLASYFLLSMDENRLFDIVDTQVLEQGKEEAIVAFANLARRCLNLHGKMRPSMKEVAIELERIRKLENPAIKDGHTQEKSEAITHSEYTVSANKIRFSDSQPLLFSGSMEISSI